MSFNIAPIMQAAGAPAINELGVFPAVAAPGVLGPLALLATGVALYRAGATPRWATIALALGAALFPVSRIGEIGPMMIVVDLLLCAGLIPLGLRLFARERVPVRH